MSIVAEMNGFVGNLIYFCFFKHLKTCKKVSDVRYDKDSFTETPFEHKIRLWTKMDQMMSFVQEINGFVGNLICLFFLEKYKMEYSFIILINEQ